MGYAQFATIKPSSGTETHQNLEISTCGPLKYKVDNHTYPMYGKSQSDWKELNGGGGGGGGEAESGPELCCE